MAKQQNNSSVGSHEFNKGLNKDLGNIFVPPNVWGHARNAINNSKTGDLGKLGNEPANELCTELKNSLNPLATPQPYTVIGTIHLESDKWVIFSTNATGTASEIGIFEEGLCKYTLAVNDPCLGFSTDFLIKGVSRATGDCVYEIYWDDGNNPSRYLTLDVLNPSVNVYTNPNSPIPWIQTCVDSNGGLPGGCIICTNTSALDCDKIRLAKLINPICATATKGPGAGTLLNGSYMAAIAYSIGGQKISDYYVTNIVGLFDHDNSASSLEVIINQIDTRFDEIQVVVVSMINQQTVARLSGIYSTRQLRLSFDNINNTWPAVPIEQLPLMTPIIDKTDAMYNVGEYLIRVGPTSKLDFNYQPLANQIRTKWVSVEYDADYYRKAGINTGYMRDEVYPFFVRWLYDTGDKSNDYHIPGRPSIPSDKAPSASFVPALDPINQRWSCENTAVVTATFIPPANPTPDGGQIIAEGYMGYWESTEFYPDDKPQVWNPSTHPWSIVPPVTPYSGGAPFNTLIPANYDLCGEPIRHHKFPEDNLHPNVNIFNSGAGNKIRIMGVKFENVLPPRDNAGNLIPGIIGYEILRGTRNGNKTVIAKGIINNMGLYNIPSGVTSRQGAYPNYPYNDLRPDPFLMTISSTGPSGVLTVNPGNVNSGNLQSNFSDTLFTFHSPETNFTNPYLSAKELKVYGEINGGVIGKFEKSEKHPKEKLITDFSFLMAAIGGIGIANLAMNGQKLTVRSQPKTPGYSQAGLSGLTTFSAPYGIGTTSIASSATNIQTEPTFIDDIGIGVKQPILNALNLAVMGVLQLGGALGANLTGVSTEDLQQGVNILQGTLSSTGGSKAFPTVGIDINQEEGNTSRQGPFSLFATLPMFSYYFTEGTDSIIEFITSTIRYRDYALRYHSHGFYNNFIGTTPMRREITEEQYLGPQLSNFSNVRINNTYRNRTVALELANSLPNPTIADKTRYRVSDVAIPGFLKDPTKSEIDGLSMGLPLPGQYEQVASSHYTALKQRIRNQYGQLINIVQVPIPGCYKSILDPVTGVQLTTPSATSVLFGGDVYIGRYTEKNTFFYFYDWLYDQPDGGQLDYHSHEMVAYPRYWANFNKFETSDFTTSIVSAITTGGGTITIPFGGPTINLPPTPSAIWGSAVTPSDYYCLDGYNPTPPGLTSPSGWSTFKFSIQNAWFYLFNSGVRDFFVESEINLDYRDYGNNDAEVHYDPRRFTDTKALFDTAIIKAGNYYKYDQSLSISKLFFNYASWANTQSRDYDPYKAETCYQYRPRRVNYSLPAKFEGKRDNWLIFLANNYYDFLSKVTCIKPVNKNGAVILFESASPVEFQGTDQLQTGLGTKLTIGDGGLFSQPLQTLTNADRPYEYASCQDRLSVINTPSGVFWMSQNQGKIFNLTNSLEEISMHDLKWWFAQYLPYKLSEIFPNFELKDNPVTGIGCQAIYDNENQLVYFCKKDYILRPGYTPNATPIGLPATGPGNIQYNGSNNFIYTPTGLPIKLGDPLYFEDASWTVSYDPKNKTWLGWHDWHPELLLPGKNTFMSTITDPLTKRGGIWIHNQRCDLYCNYYGVDYPFEVEYMVNTPQQITTLRSIEYYMEVYKYDRNCYDRFHVLDYNFDEAVIYNTEQCSGILRMTPSPRQSPDLMIGYPIINPTFIEILYSKVENKYRFNQFWDITDDRGEYPLYPAPPVVQRMIWNTGANGYVKVLNPANLNYNKPEFQRKKLRHYTNSVFLRKRVIAGQQMTYKILVMITENKQLNSPR